MGNPMKSIGILFVSIALLTAFNAAVAQESVPFDTYGYVTNPAGDPVDPEWLAYCLGEGFNAGFQGTRVGTATHLGNYTSKERGCLDFSLFPIVQSRNIEMTFIAANGDELFATSEADFDFFNPPEVTWGVFEFVGGSGRFESASGGGEVRDIGIGASGAVLRMVGEISYDASDRRNSDD
jgi:hypothetical protein